MLLNILLEKDKDHLESTLKKVGTFPSSNSQLGDASTVSSAISVQQPKESIILSPPKASTKRGFYVYLYAISLLLMAIV